jgi:hypothetical protein
MSCFHENHHPPEMLQIFPPSFPSVKSVPSVALTAVSKFNHFPAAVSPVEMTWMKRQHPIASQTARQISEAPKGRIIPAQGKAKRRPG